MCKDPLRHDGSQKHEKFDDIIWIWADCVPYAASVTPQCDM